MGLLAGVLVAADRWMGASVVLMLSVGVDITFSGLGVKDF